MLNGDFHWFVVNHIFPIETKLIPMENGWHWKIGWKSPMQYRKQKQPKQITNKRRRATKKTDEQQEWMKSKTEHVHDFSRCISRILFMKWYCASSFFFFTVCIFYPIHSFHLIDQVHFVHLQEIHFRLVHHHSFWYCMCIKKFGMMITSSIRSVTIWARWML